MWTSDRNVNVIAAATLSDYPKVCHAAIRFFLRTNEELEHDAADDSDSEEEGNAQKEYNRIMQANERNKKSGKRKKRMERALKSVKKAEKKASRAPSFHFAALQHINDPQVRRDGQRLQRRRPAPRRCWRAMPACVVHSPFSHARSSPWRRSCLPSCAAQRRSALKSAS